MELDRIKRVYVIGLGAIGGMVAAQLQQVEDVEIKIIADWQRIAVYQQQAFTVNGQMHQFTFADPEESHPAADLIIIAVKSPQLHAAIKSIRPFVGQQTVVMSLLNGISSEELIAEAIGMEHVLYAYAVGMDAVRQQTEIRYTNPGRIVFGEPHNDVLSPRVKLVQQLMERAGIPHLIPPDMRRAMWTKFMLNTGINQASAILKASYGVFQQNEHARQLMLMAAAEVVELSQHCGIHLDQADLDEFVRVIHTLDPLGKTSMLQDIEAGRKTEVDLFAGTVVELGRKYQVATPVNQLLLLTINVLEGR